MLLVFIRLCSLRRCELIWEFRAVLHRPAQYIPVPRVGKYMKERDVRFILGNLAKTLNISNPYDDDYYYY